ncbi:MAG: ATP-binding cassette domain-containing protein, partial [Bdellovibrionales bacterium]|nr:ATP-binding cassette domain-containing protein [Bdellovibrionales bacterium]NQZ19901.1 ATP-binding cassette domain-containing protein [Bdellovibrionales bacterium]
MTPVVELSHLKFKWPGQETEIINMESFKVEKGETVFLQGPSGSGKSTLLNLIGGVLSPDAGTVSILGKKVSQLSLGRRDQFRGDHLGFIFQMFNLIPYFSAVENVVLPCQFSSLKSKKVLSQSESLDKEAERLLSALGLDSKTISKKSVTQLSVGQQQRVATARALMG